MKLEDFMKANDLRDADMAALLVDAGVECDRSTVSRLRRGKCWLSKNMAVALRKATGNRVTADDFAVELTKERRAS